MTPSLRTLWGCVACLAGAALIPTSWQWAQSTRACQTQVDRLAKLSAQAASINELRGKLPAWVLAEKAAGTLAPEVSAILGASGLPASTLSSLSADPEPGNSAAGPVQARTRHATLVLGSVTLAQLGTFLQQWRERQPTWTVAAIDVTPEPAGPAAAAKAQTGGDLPLRAVLTLETVTLQRSGGVR